MSNLGIYNNNCERSDYMKTVIIVESPSKSKTIANYVGDDTIVLATVGHIRELATSGTYGLGIDLDNDFKPNYKVSKGKEKVIKEMIKATNKNNVLIATDPDREGEAIAWHVADMLNLDVNDNNRITFNEVTKDAVLKAVSEPRKIDMDVVHSQEARRILDRIIGFRLSKLLQQKIGSKSAGRVQSVALKMIVDLEKEILAFIPEEYHLLQAHFNSFDADYYLNSSKAVKSEAEAKAIIDKIKGPFSVKAINKKKLTRSANPAYVTSTLQQDGINKLGYSGSRVMGLAQALYEGKEISDETVGLITYMRTDSTRLSNDFITDAHNEITRLYGKEYVGKPKIGKKKASQQDAHEAIRPTSIHRTPELMKHYLTDQEFKVYKMIYDRALFSLMADAIYEITSVEFINHDEIFKASSSKLVFEGHHKANQNYEPNQQTLPPLKVDDKIEAHEITSVQQFTKPKSRYTEASLIKDLEELGVGRPSTYAEINKTLLSRKYIEKIKSSLMPTEQGLITSDSLDKYFSSIINTEYTKYMETELDEISLGNKVWNVELMDFYKRFEPILDNAFKEMVKLPPKEVGELCPECNRPLVFRNNKKGQAFIACSGFTQKPQCKYTRSVEEKTEDKVEDKTEDKEE